MTPACVTVEDWRCPCIERLRWQRNKSSVKKNFKTNRPFYFAELPSNDTKIVLLQEHDVPMDGNQTGRGNRKNKHHKKKKHHRKNEGKKQFRKGWESESDTKSFHRNGDDKDYGNGKLFACCEYFPVLGSKESISDFVVVPINLLKNATILVNDKYYNCFVTPCSFTYF